MSDRTCARHHHDNVEWLETLGSAARSRRMRIGRCVHCRAFVVDLSTRDPDRPANELHDICVVQHRDAHTALFERDPIALARISTQLRRRHLEELVGIMPLRDRTTLEKIEQGKIPASETFRGLVTRRIAVSEDLPVLEDVRTPRFRRNNGRVGVRTALEFEDGSRAVLETNAHGLVLSRMRGDAVIWRREIATAARDASVARVTGRTETELVLLTTAASSEPNGELYIIDGKTGSVRAKGLHGCTSVAFEAHALPAGCLFIACYQTCAVVRADGSTAWQGASTAVPVAMPLEDSVVVIDAPSRLVALALPSGTERWSMPIERGTQIARSEPGCLLLSTTDLIARLEVGGPRPRLLWAASGSSALALHDGGAAVVRERCDNSSKIIECVIFDSQGRRKYTLLRQEGAKVPIAEIGPGVLLFHSGGDVAVTVNDRVSYVLALPDEQQARVTVDHGGAWIEYEGVVDRIDKYGQREGRWRLGSSGVIQSAAIHARAV